MQSHHAPRKLWEHHDPSSTAMWDFLQLCNKRFGLDMKSFHDLYKWSCDRRSDFYDQLWKTGNWIHEGTYSQVVDESVPVSKLPKWFEGVRANWAENFLWTRKPGGRPGELWPSDGSKADDKVAATEIREGNTSVRHITWGELREQTGRLAGAMHANGVTRGDRIVIVGSHSLQTLMVNLAALWLGAIFTSSSTDMGVGGLLQRTVQINPKYVFFDDGTLYNGKKMPLADKIAGLVDGLKDCNEFKRLIVIQRFDNDPINTSQIPKTQRMEDFLSSAPQQAPSIVRVGFQDPAWIFYSSGTTGTPFRPQWIPLLLTQEDRPKSRQALSRRKQLQSVILR